MITMDTLLAILQQSEYDLSRLQLWYMAHQHDDHEVKPAKWTSKLKLIKFIVTWLVFLPPLLRLRVALWFTQPGEFLIRGWTYRQAANKLHELRKNGLVVVAIAGTYGKTSTKHILQHTLGKDRATLMTPQSINTLLGISQVILDQLTPKHRVFLTEIGEYKPGQVKELLHFLQPDWGILTPIGHQHVELLGSFDRVVAEFKDFQHFFEPQPTQLLISDRNSQWLAGGSKYGESHEAAYHLDNVKVSRAGTEFRVVTPTLKESARVFMPLFGAHQAVNTLPSFWLAEKLKISVTLISKSLSTMPFIERRHQPTFAQQNVLILDNSYNTNPESIHDSLKLLNQLNQGQRVIVTAGFVEQGQEARQVHEDLGKTLAKQVDFLGLFSAKYEAEIRQGFLTGGGQADQIVTGSDQADVIQKLQSRITPGSVIILEGGYQEIHS